MFDLGLDDENDGLKCSFPLASMMEDYMTLYNVTSS